MYRPLAKTSAFDYRSTYSFSTNLKPAASETKYSSVNLDIMPGDQYLNPTRSCLSGVCATFLKVASIICFVLTLPFSAIICLKMVRQYERMVIYRIGHLLPLKGPGIVLVLPCIDRWSKVDLRTKAFNVPPTRICTTDGGLILFGSIVHYRVQNPVLVKNSLQDMNHSVRVACQAAMSKVLSKKRCLDLKTSSSRYNYDIQIEINQSAVEWGIEIGKVELSQPSIEFAPPEDKKSGFFSQLASGMSGGLGGGDSSMTQLMSAMAEGAGFSNPAFPHENHSTAPSITSTPVTAVENALQNLMNALRCSINAEIVAKVGAAYEIKISENNKYYYIDLKRGSGSCGEGRLLDTTPDATLLLSYKTLHELLTGQIGAFSAYTNGYLDVQGDVKSAMRLEELAKSLKV